MKKHGKKRRGHGTGAVPWWGGEDGQKSHLGMPPNCQDNRHRWSIRGVEKGETAGLWQTDRDNTDGWCYSPVHPDWDASPSVCAGADSWNVETREQSWGEDCCWL